MKENDEHSYDLPVQPQGLKRRHVATEGEQELKAVKDASEAENASQLGNEAPPIEKSIVGFRAHQHIANVLFSVLKPHITMQI